jgi:DNA-binding transcriptional regulator YhcF (GntR family)
MDQVKTLISSGRLSTGDTLPSVRLLSSTLEINMMTVSKAYSKLEAEGILQRSRGKGMMVKESKPVGTVSERQKQLRNSVKPLINRGKQLNLTDEQILNLVKKMLKESKP